MKAAYVNAIGGASGDMLLASLVDSGLDLVGLSSVLASVGVEGFQLKALLGDRQGVKGTHVEVNIDRADPGKRTPPGKIVDTLRKLGESCQRSSSCQRTQFEQVLTLTSLY